ncbi:MAG: DNA-3-methyladenine glycosylase [Bacteroidales bacterium]|nr:DNA-3-methyladenine glycosylase [Bacteroidales bacterium]
MMWEKKSSSENGTNSKTKSLIDQMASGKRLSVEFFVRDVLDVAPDLIGKIMVIRLAGKTFGRYQITEVEAYRGTEDKACHAFRGRTARTEIMFHEGGRLYVYLIYGMYWMLNIVTGQVNNPQAVLIRGVENHNGPGKITKSFGIDRTFYGEDLNISERIWIEDAGVIPLIKTGPRIGIDYAGEYWKTRPWRYYK